MHHRKVLAIAAVALVVLGMGTSLSAQPRISPQATVAQSVGVTDIEVTYSRPSVKGRTVFGELEPWGKVWRTGANEATTFSASTDIKVEGKALPAGKYALFTIPSKDGWTVIFNREADQWGAFQYKEAEDVLRVEVQPTKAPHQEQFEIAFPEVGGDTALMTLHWQESRIPVRLAVDLEKTAFGRAQAEVKEATSAQNGRVIYGWASFFLNQGTHLDEALGWAKSITASAPDLYWGWSLQARLEQKSGRSGEAATTAKKALELAEAQKEAPGVAGDAKTLAEEMASWSQP